MKGDILDLYLIQWESSMSLTIMYNIRFFVIIFIRLKKIHPMILIMKNLKMNNVYFEQRINLKRYLSKINTNYQILNKESIVQSKSEQDLAQRVLKLGALN